MPLNPRPVKLIGSMGGTMNADALPQDRELLQLDWFT